MTNDCIGGSDSGRQFDAYSIMEISDTEFVRIQNLIHRYFGIHLSGEKRSLVVGRLQRLLRENKFDTFDAYLNYVEADTTGIALSSLIDHISTNHTFFFRESEHFDYLKTFVLPHIDERLKRERSNDIRIWSAGCSGGDEAYSIVIILMEYFRERYGALDAGLLATDISEAMLREATTGVYNEKRIALIPEPLRNKYFDRMADGLFSVKHFLKREVTFRRFNLTNSDFPFKKPFDIIFCRNVMIYFNRDIRKKLVHNLYHQTRNGGYLLVGHSESLNVMNYPYAYIKPGIYQKRIGL